MNKVGKKKSKVKFIFQCKTPILNSQPMVRSFVLRSFFLPLAGLVTLDINTNIKMINLPHVRIYNTNGCVSCYHLTSLSLLNGSNHLHNGRWYCAFRLARYLEECHSDWWLNVSSKVIVMKWSRVVQSKHEISNQMTIPHVWIWQDFATNFFS